jgi:hypothetical protein
LSFAFDCDFDMEAMRRLLLRLLGSCMTYDILTSTQFLQEHFVEAKGVAPHLAELLLGKNLLNLSCSCPITA